MRTQLLALLASVVRQFWTGFCQRVAWARDCTPSFIPLLWSIVFTHKSSPSDLGSDLLGSVGIMILLTIVCFYMNSEKMKANVRRQREIGSILPPSGWHYFWWIAQYYFVCVLAFVAVSAVLNWLRMDDRPIMFLVICLLLGALSSSITLALASWPAISPYFIKPEPLATTKQEPLDWGY